MTVVSAEDFQAKIEAAAAAFIPSGGDEDQMEANLCLLVPESCVAMLIGKGGSNVNLIKAASGATVSFAKKENSANGLRKCFHAGTMGAVSKAVFINVVLVGETQVASGGKVSVSLLVNNNAAGSVIGKGGEHLKAIREQTGCFVNMEKQGEGSGVGGRALQVSHQDSAATVAQAVFSFMRLTGFASLTSAEDRSLSNVNAYDAGASYGYGPASSLQQNKNRYSPYGASDSVCALHGKKRGKQNLQPSATLPGQFQCFDHDACKGSVVNPNAGLEALGMAGMGYGAAMGGMGAQGGMLGAGMGGIGMGQNAMMGMMGGYGMDMTGMCALHNKKRGPRNLQPHPTQPGMYTCMDNDMCKGSGGADASGNAIPQSSNAAGMCSTHNKRRGARNLQPHPTTPGVFMCLDGDACK